MRITVERLFADGDTTISVILIDGKASFFGLEDEYRAVKVAGETRIPAGSYAVRVRTFGGFHERYGRDPRFQDIHKGMLEIVEVPGFTDILVHCGNTEKHTAGCLLVGFGATVKELGMSIQASGDAYRAFYSQVIAAAQAGDLDIAFVDRDRG